MASGNIWHMHVETDQRGEHPRPHRSHLQSAASIASSRCTLVGEKATTSQKCSTSRQEILEDEPHTPDYLDLLSAAFAIETVLFFLLHMLMVSPRIRV
jgi:uncharacterized protein (DUF849 family)